MISYSAPGKIILSGEHSVVYTKPAFVTAIDLALTFSIRKKRATDVISKTKEVTYSENIVKKYLQKNNISFSDQEYIYKIDSRIPEGRGMGSSAAFCVASVAALLHFYTGKQYEKQVINSLAYQCEKYFHGMPSGVDVSASCFGGLIFYRKEFEFLKTISALNFKIPKKFQDNMILINTGRPVETTADMVKHVGNLYNKHPKEMEQTLAGIERVTKRMVIAVIKEDIKMFTDAIEENQKLLVKLGIVSKETQQLLIKLKPFGVGKVTGAGGLRNGSGMILFMKESGKNIHEIIPKEEIVSFKQNYRGVTLE